MLQICVLINERILLVLSPSSSFSAFFKAPKCSLSLRLSSCFNFRIELTICCISVGSVRIEQLWSSSSSLKGRSEEITGIPQARASTIALQHHIVIQSSTKNYIWAIRLNRPISDETGRNTLFFVSKSDRFR